MTCERCNRNVVTLKAVKIVFPEFRTEEKLRAADWHDEIYYWLCADCGHEMRRKVLDTCARVLQHHSTRRDRRELPI